MYNLLLEATAGLAKHGMAKLEVRWLLALTVGTDSQIELSSEICTKSDDLKCALIERSIYSIRIRRRRACKVIQE